MIPADTNCEAGPHEVERASCREAMGDRTADAAVGRERHTLLPSSVSSSSRTQSLPRRRTRLASTTTDDGGADGFKGVKRSRRRLKLPTGRMLRAHVRTTERLRTLVAAGETSSPIDTQRSKVDAGSTTLPTDFDDAVVPRCVLESGRVEEEEVERRRRRSDVPAAEAVASAGSCVILSVPVAPKDAKRPCFCHQHHHHPQHQHHPSRPHHHHQHQDQEQQQHPHHLSPGCQMSQSSLFGRVPTNPPRLINIPIPDDPRQWSRLDVRTWLDHVRRVYDIGDLDLDRFPMNGKALCIMSRDMFVYRVPNGGVPLYVDFQLRFRRALSIR